MLDARSKPDATPPLPGWVTADVIADTCAVFEPLYRRPLSDDEVVELLLNVGRLFAALTKAQADPPPTRADPIVPSSAPRGNRRAGRRHAHNHE